MYKRLAYQFILCNLLLFISWFSTQISNEVSEVNIEAEMICFSPPTIDAVTFEITTSDAFSRQRIVEYKALEQTRIFLKDEEYEILLKIVEAEAGGEDEIGRMLVASVVLNRISHENFPDSLKEVVYQSVNGNYQFSPVGSGRYKRAKVSTETIEAVDKVLWGGDYSEGALFFASRKAADPEKMRWFDRNLKKLFSHGGHEFFGL